MYLATSAYTMGPGRITSIVAALIAIVAVVLAAPALRRASRSRAIAALVAGPVGIVLGAIVVFTADGGLGTGNGLGGGVVAALIGVAGTVLGGLALARARRT